MMIAGIDAIAHLTINITIEPKGIFTSVISTLETSVVLASGSLLFFFISKDDCATATDKPYCAERYCAFPTIKKDCPVVCKTCSGKDNYT
jgi:hypothetical protein